MSKTKISPRKVLWMCAIGAAILGLATASWLGYRILSYKQGAEDLSRSLSVLRTEVSAGEIASAKRTAITLRDQSETLKGISKDPLWKAATKAPLVGPNFYALSEISVSLDDLINSGLMPVLERIEPEEYERLKPNPFSANLERIQELAPVLSTSASAIQLSYDRLSGIDTEKLVDPISTPLQDSLSTLDSVRQTMNSLAMASNLLPEMMGINEAREYLVLIQNNAEARATGGIPGALAVLRTHDGRINLTEQASAAGLGPFTPALSVDKEQEIIFSSRMGRYMQSVNLTPDFPTAASTAKRMWEERHPGQALDGVLALDPVVLAHLLDATGPMEVTDPVALSLVADTALPATLTSENVVPTLLSDVYREIEEPALQDIYFASVASEIFEGFTTSLGGPSRLLDALTLSAREQRLFLWSAHESEQELISQTALAGEVTGSRVGGTAFGMYFNDGTGAKMDFYAARTVQLIQECRAEGYGVYTLRVSVTNNAPLDAKGSLPPYVTGGGAFGVDPGNIRTNYVAYGPAQSFVQGARLNGSPIPFAPGVHGLRPVGTATIELAPGESAELEFTFSKVVQDAEPKVSVTPTVDPVSDVVLPLIKEQGCA